MRRFSGREVLALSGNLPRYRKFLDDPGETGKTEETVETVETVDSDGYG